MNVHALEPVPVPTIIEPSPVFELPLTSTVQRWGGIFVCYFVLTPQLEPVPAPQTTAHSILCVRRNSGGLRSWINGRHERSYLTPGYISLMPYPNTVRYSWANSPEVGALYLAPALIAQAAEASQLPFERVELCADSNMRDPLIEQITHALLAELHNRSPLGRVYADSLIQTLALHLVRHHSNLVPTRSFAPHGLSHQQQCLVRDFIHEHLHADLSLADLAALVQLSPSYFARQFKRATGLAPHQYLVRCRVERAHELLRDGKLSIAQVAQAVGFADHAHLTRHFTRLLGYAPRDVRRTGKNVQEVDKNIQDATG